MRTTVLLEATQQPLHSEPSSTKSLRRHECMKDWLRRLMNQCRTLQLNFLMRQHQKCRICTQPVLFLSRIPTLYGACNELRQAVIKEALRIHPAVGFQLERIAPRGGITLCQTNLPEGTILGMNAWVLHRDKQIFGDDVEGFRPERWLDATDEELKMMNRSFFSIRELPSSKHSFPHIILLTDAWI